MVRSKWCMDWLVKRGYLATDRASGLMPAALPTQRISRKDDPTVTITLIRVP